MKIRDLFASNEKLAKLSHLKHLVGLAHADGVIKDSELAAIAVVMHRDGLTERDFKRCIEEPQSIDYQKLTTDRDRLTYLTDMVLLMMADGNIDENELLLCKLTAESLGYKHEIVDDLVLGLIAHIKYEML